MSDKEEMSTAWKVFGPPIAFALEVIILHWAWNTIVHHIGVNVQEIDYTVSFCAIMIIECVLKGRVF